MSTASSSIDRVLRRVESDTPALPSSPGANDPWFHVRGELQSASNTIQFLQVGARTGDRSTDFYHAWDPPTKSILRSLAETLEKIAKGAGSRPGLSSLSFLRRTYSSQEISQLHHSVQEQVLKLKACLDTLWGASLSECREWAARETSPSAQKPLSTTGSVTLDTSTTNSQDQHIGTEISPNSDSSTIEVNVRQIFISRPFMSQNYPSLTEGTVRIEIDTNPDTKGVHVNYFPRDKTEFPSLWTVQRGARTELIPDMTAISINEEHQQLTMVFRKWTGSEWATCRLMQRWIEGKSK